MNNIIKVKNLKKRIAAIGMAAVMSVSALAVVPVDAQTAGSTKVSVTNLRVSLTKNGCDYYCKTLKKGKSFTIKSKVSGASNKKVTYKVISGSKYVKVSKSGKVTAKKKGTAVVKITSKANAKKYCKVKVTVGTPASKMKVSKGSVLVSTGKTVSLTARIANQASNKNILFVSSNKKAAKVVSTKVGSKETGQRRVTIKGLKAGKTTLYAIAADGSGIKKKITIKVKGVKAVSVPKKNVAITTGTAYTVKPTVSVTYGASKAVTYASSNKTVATVSSKGVITARKAGTATITVKSKADSSKKASVKITVVDKKLTVTGATVQLNPPSSVVGTVKSWSSSSEYVTVSDAGRVTVKQGSFSGTKTVTVTAKGTKGTYTYKLTVTGAKPAKAVTGISVAMSSVSLIATQTSTIEPTVTTSGEETYTAKYESSNSSVASVSSSGKITANKAGKATITVTATGKTSKTSKSCTVSVSVSALSLILKISPGSVLVKSGETAIVYARITDTNCNQGLTFKSSNEDVFTVENVVQSNSNGQMKCTIKGRNFIADAELEVIAKDGSKKTITVTNDFADDPGDETTETTECEHVWEKLYDEQEIELTPVWKDHKTVCKSCGFVFSTGDGAYAWGHEWYHSHTSVSDVRHSATTETKKVLVGVKCSKCGEIKRYDN